MPGSFLYYALALFVIALGAAIFGFGGVAANEGIGPEIFLWVGVGLLIVCVSIALIRRM